MVSHANGPQHAYSCSKCHINLNLCIILSQQSSKLVTLSFSTVNWQELIYGLDASPFFPCSLVLFFSGKRRRAAHHYIKKEGVGNPRWYSLGPVPTQTRKKPEKLLQKHYKAGPDQLGLKTRTYATWDPRARRCDTPRAPAKDHWCSSSLIPKITQETLGVIPSKTQRLRCFQMVHAPKINMESNPFLTRPSTLVSTSIHHSKKDRLFCGAKVCRLNTCSLVLEYQHQEFKKGHQKSNAAELLSGESSRLHKRSRKMKPCHQT